MGKWYPLDNAAQIFPALIKKHDTNSFRLSALLYENVDPEILEQAVSKTLERYPTFKVLLRKGLFWYYLNENTFEPVVRKEDPYFCESQNFRKQNYYLFNVMYYGRRIAIDVFHGLTDGNGGMEFLKSLVYNYLILKGYNIPDEGKVLTNDFEQLFDEDQDSFAYNYQKDVKQKSQESKAFKITGKTHKDHWTGAIQAIIDLDTLKQASKKYNATVTEYIGSLLIYSIQKEYRNKEKNKKNKKRPIRLFVPVNIRKYFKSKTLRNFVLFIRTTSNFNDDVTFEEVVAHVKETFKNEINEEQMLARLKTNMKLEKNFLVRFMPLVIKILIIRLVYSFIGTGSNTISFSNLGLMEVPSEMFKYVERFDFANGASINAPVNVSLVTYNNKTVLTFADAIIERKLQKKVIELMLNDGVNLHIETNDLEV